MRLAWFTPWPPQPSGIAACSVDATRELASRGYAIDVFVDRRAVSSAARASNGPPGAGEIRVQSAHEFVWRHHRAQYDLTIYQLGNSTTHAFIWPYLLRYPGLTVLHDAHLHHSRGAALLRPGDSDEYRAALRLDHPELPSDAAELAVMGFDGRYYYLWPMLRSAILASRGIGVHARGSAVSLSEAWPDHTIGYIALSQGQGIQLDDQARRAVRRALGVPDDALLLGVFGGLTADKRVPQVITAFAALRRHHPHAHLLLAGAAAPGLSLPSLIDEHGLAAHVTLAPNLDDETFDRAIAAVDISLNLRWPTARETSGPWLRALASGRATVVIDLAHQAHVPALDPQTWHPRPSATDDEPVTVAIDILDEAHSLGLALSRLAAHPELRQTLGAAARRYWTREHTIVRMADDYVRLIDRTVAQPVRTWTQPDGTLVDPCRLTRDLVAPFGNLSCALF